MFPPSLIQFLITIALITAESISKKSINKELSSRSIHSTNVGSNFLNHVFSPRDTIKGSVDQPKNNFNASSNSFNKSSQLTDNPTQNFDFEIIQAPKGYENWTSPIVLPAPVQDGSFGWGSVFTRAKEFVSQLTIEEKVNLTTGSGVNGPCVGQTGTIPRLGFNQPICFQDGPSGVRFTDFVSVFPSPINIAATFDKNLMRRRGIGLGKEFFGKGVNVALGPMVNLMRSPTAGRNWESFGADAFLSGVSSVETILGMQSTGVSACVKHFVGAEQEHFRGGGHGADVAIESSNIDDRTMHEVYAWPFAESIRIGVDYVMCSYNRVNQTQACENSKLINGILKTEHKFQGVVISDWAAAISGVRSALAGLDMNQPGFERYGQISERDPSKANSSYWGLQLIESIKNGSVPISRLDDMVQRIISTYFKRGQDKKSYPARNFHSFGQGTLSEQAEGNEHVNVQAEHYKLIREIGAASTVLLKNVRQSLPLPSPDKLKSIAILGSSAGNNPNGPNSCQHRGCNVGSLAIGWGSGSVDFTYLVSPASAIEAYIRAKNPTISLDVVLNDTDFTEVTIAASRAEVALVHVTADSGEGYIEVEGNEGDRKDLKLWHSGDELISSTASVCSNTIIIIHSVGAVDMEAWINHPNVTAVIYAGLPGQELGNAEVDILWGQVNPSARLPFTIAKNRTDYPADVLYNSSLQVPQINYKEGMLLDYRHFDHNKIEPRFEFGYGLSYTNFSYSDIRIKTDRRRLYSDRKDPHDNELSVTFLIENVGRLDGHEVAQLYLGFPDNIGEPIKVLRGFERIFIKSRDRKEVVINLRVIDISIWDVISQNWIVPRGKMMIWIGSSSREILLTSDFSFDNEL
ncbi:hypothetical protein CROQUDRAFT_663111 [Cronartium quercuum f. sp. fusiforme G11]|uniref:beta-glucosidase n=1 Tax=Cronartium quercuum f. sp. fusiforme G11 TaxID=708437 RepID=A0A9P6T7E7_9BASI|nr:hypothetical protein CROQUDRAFT_663111 [Cronartium quercuum f. sp. fusiforme G11]